MVNFGAVSRDLFHLTIESALAKPGMLRNLPSRSVHFTPRIVFDTSQACNDLKPVQPLTSRFSTEKNTTTDGIDTLRWQYTFCRTW